MSLRALRPNGLQPIARQVGRRRYGVPEGGPFDTVSARLANSLLGLDPLGPVYELTPFGATLWAEEAVLVSVVGAPCRVCVGGFETAGNRAFGASSGTEIRVIGTNVGARIYVAWRTGVRDSDRLVVGLADSPASLEPGPLKLLPGPASSLVSMSDLVAGEWRVASESDRVGLRCVGPRFGDGCELPSEPACVGAVQLTPSGTLLIVGPDGPTLGGYPKIGVVASVDHARLGQLRPGDAIRFEPSDRLAALRAWREREKRLARLESSIQWSRPWS